MIKQWFVYILKCADGSLYTGITTDVQRRVRQHDAGTGAKYTRMKRPVRLVYQEEQPDRSTASVREYQIKQLRKKKKKALIGSV